MVFSGYLGHSLGDGWRPFHAASDESESLVDDFALLLEFEHALAQIQVLEVAARDRVLVLLRFVFEVDAFVVPEGGLSIHVGVNSILRHCNFPIQI